MTGYETIDPILMAWARKKGVHVYTQYQGVDVRSIAIYEPSGQERGMWIDPVDNEGRVRVRLAGLMDGDTTAP